MNEETPPAPEAAPPTPAPTPAPEYVQVTKADWEALNTRAAKIDTIEATLGQRFDTASMPMQVSAASGSRRVASWKAWKAFSGSPLSRCQWPRW